MKKLIILLFIVVGVTGYAQNTQFDSLLLVKIKLSSIAQKGIDTTTYKTIVTDASGNIFKMYWPVFTGGGTVSSVAQTVPTSLLSISGSPVTTTGTLAIGLTTAAAHNFWGNNTGSTATPAYYQPAFTDLSGSLQTSQEPAHTGNVTNTAGSLVLTIGANQVTNSMFSTMVAHTYKGNNTGSTANAADITSTQLTADLNAFTSSLQGLVPSSGGGTTNFLRADGTWTTPGGGGTVSSVATGLGLSGGTITTTGTLLVDTSYLMTKGSAQLVAGLKTFSTTPIITTLDGYIQGNGTSVLTASNTIPTTDLTGILASANGGTANGFFTVSGPATSAKTFTFPNASATILTSNAAVTVAQGGTGAATLTGVLKGNGTSAFTAATSGTDYSAGTSALGTGILKSTTTTGALTIAIAADFPTLNQNTSGTASNLSGTPALPNGTTATTQSASDNTTKIATTAYADAIATLKANLASPTFTGTPVLPTGTTGVTQTTLDNSTKLATTAYVDGLSQGATYTTTPSAITNVGSSTFTSGMVLRIGNIVYVRLTGTVTASLIATATTLRVGLPILTSNGSQGFIGTGQIALSGTSNFTSATVDCSGVLTADIHFISSSTSATVFVINFLYTL